MKKSLVFVLFSGFILTAIFSCSSNNNEPQVGNINYSAYKNFTYDVAINNKTSFSLDGINGSITITPVSADEKVATILAELKVQSESIEDATDALEDLNVKVNESSNDAYVYTQQPDKTFGRIYTVTYNLKLPVHWAVTITNLNGTLTIDSLQNTINAEIKNGNVSLNAIDADNVYAKVENGNIYLNEVSASTDLNLVNGYISGNTILPAGGLSNMDVTNGTINLQLPQNTDALLKAKVVNGSVGVNNLSMQNITSSTTYIQGTLGTGDGVINLSVVNGSINVLGY